MSVETVRSSNSLPTLRAGAAINAYRAVVITSGEFVQAGAGSGTKGVHAYLSQDAYADGDTVTAFRSGDGLLTVNGNSVNIAAGDYIKTTANGIGVKAATAGDIASFRALAAATTDGAIIRVDILNPPYTIPS
jgi:hypothetical protein